MNEMNIKMELTGLQKLTKEQLINIILRKDDMEKRLSCEVGRLQRINRQLTELIEEMDDYKNN
ncbi:hypothetical protein [Sodaliphilus sp.]|uniref:hypothetical protein n=1 Tax=Sodaliphilus sp. TaxID=2815818 RepID=UPI00388FCEA7